MKPHRDWRPRGTPEPRPGGPSDATGRLEEALAEYLEALDRGEEPAREDYLERYPEIADELRKHFDDEDYLARVRGGLPRFTVSESPPDIALRAGETFGDFELLEVIGNGGMGIVYRARQRSLKRTLALKTIRPDRLDSNEGRARFRLEAEAAARLDHPAIVSVYQVGEIERVPFIAMRLLEGASLASRRSEFSPDPRASARLIEQVARAVEYAHSRGVLHRDLKPGNILFDDQDRPHVVDFGLAKIDDGSESLTRSGDLVGTVKYMAPEQAAGRRRDISSATDIYSLGAILYELLAGRPPFQADSSLETLRQIVEEEPQPPSRSSSTGTRVPLDLETICLKCLEKSPRARYRSAADLADDLVRYLEGKSISARRSGPLERGAKWARRRPAMTALLAVSILSAVVLGAFIVRDRERQRLRGAELEAVIARIYRAGRLRDASFAVQAGDLSVVDETFETLSADSSNGVSRSFEERFVEALSHRERAGMKVPSGAGAGLVRFSEDGKTLSLRHYITATPARSTLWDLSGATPRRTFHAQIPPGAVATPDEWLLIEDGALIVRPFDSADPRVRIELDAEPRPTDILLSPRRHKLAVRLSNRIEVYDLGDGTKSRTVPGSDLVGMKQYAVDVADDGTVAVVHQRGLTVWREPGRLDLASDRYGASGLRLADGRFHTAFSYDAKRFAVVDADRDVQVWDLEEQGRISTLVGDQLRSPAFSRDGTRIATADGKNRLQVWETLTGREVFSSFAHAGPVGSIQFAPDDRSLVTVGPEFVKIWDVDLRPNPVGVPGHENIVRFAMFSRDGNHVATFDDDFASIIWRVQKGAHGPHLVEVRRGQVSHPPYTNTTLSRDFRWLAFGRMDGTVEIRRFSVYDASVSSAPVQEFKAHKKYVKGLGFLPDSRTLVSTEEYGGDVCFWRWSPSNSESTGERSDTRDPVGTEGSWTPWWRYHTSDYITTGTASLDSRFVLLMNGDLIDVEDRSIAAKLEYSTNWSAAFSPDSQYLLFPDRSGFVSVLRVFDERGRVQPRKLGSFLAHAQVHSIVFVPETLRFITAGRDRILRFWELIPTPNRVVASETARLELTDYPIESVALSPDGRFLITTGGVKKRGQRQGAGELKLWWVPD